jgi:hypothetical protein
MINKAFKRKTFIEYLTFSDPIYKEEEEFMKDVVKYVSEQNYLFIIENGIYEIPSKIRFTIKLAETKDSSMIKTFELTLSGKKEEKKEDLPFYETLNYDFDFCNYFYMDLNYIFEMGKYGFSMQNFCMYLKSLTEKNKDLSVVTNFPDIIANVTNLDLEAIA